jgi:hypothetical protein
MRRKFLILGAVMFFIFIVWGGIVAQYLAKIDEGEQLVDLYSQQIVLSEHHCSATAGGASL